MEPAHTRVREHLGRPLVQGRSPDKLAAALGVGEGAPDTYEDLVELAAIKAASSIEANGTTALRHWAAYGRRYGLDLAPSAFGTIGPARNEAFEVELGRFITYVAAAEPGVSGASASQYAAQVASLYKRLGGVAVKGLGDFGHAVARHYTAAKPTLASLHRTPIPLSAVRRFFEF